MRRMQVQDSPGYPRIYKNTADCIRSGSFKPQGPFLRPASAYQGHAAMCLNLMVVMGDAQADVPKGRHTKLLEVRNPPKRASHAFLYSDDRRNLS